MTSRGRRSERRPHRAQVREAADLSGLPPAYAAAVASSSSDAPACGTVTPPAIRQRRVAVGVRRHDGSAGEPSKDLAAAAAAVPRVGEPRSSLYRLLAARTRWAGRGFAPVAQLSRGPSTRPEIRRRLPGRRVGLVVSMCQIASANRRARSTWATLGAALAAQPGFGAPVTLTVDRMTAGVGGRLDQRPAQILGPVLGQRAPVVFAAGPVDPRAQPGVAQWPCV